MTKFATPCNSWTSGCSASPLKSNDSPQAKNEEKLAGQESRIWTRLEAVNGLTGGETENPNVSKKLAELACSPMPTREQSEVSNSSRLTRSGSLVVSGEMQWVNRLIRPTYQ